MPVAAGLHHRDGSVLAVTQRVAPEQASTLLVPERHFTSRIGWLRAAVLGANDGIVSTSSLVVGVAASGAGRHEILVAGAAGLVAGALSMAAGEYISVSSQQDTERAETARERRELASAPIAEEDELTGIYIARGLDAATARIAARQLTAHDALGAHLRDELGLTETHAARPLQAALASAIAFAAGALLPIVIAWIAAMPSLQIVLSVSSLAALAALGALAAVIGNAPLLPSTIRVAFWGAIAMAATAVVGKLIGHVV